MTPNIDLCRLLLRSVVDRSPPPTGFDSTTLNAHRKLLVDAGLSDRAGLLRDWDLAKNGEPLMYEYSLGPLTPRGQRFVALSSDERIWQTVKRAYEAADCDWSIDQLFDYLQKSTKESHLRTD